MHLNTSLCFEKKKTNRDKRYALIDGWAATHTLCAYLHFVVQALAWRQKKLRACRMRSMTDSPFPNPSATRRLQACRPAERTFCFPHAWRCIIIRDIKLDPNSDCPDGSSDVEEASVEHSKHRV